MALNEPYRTLLGHFRHEAGHYYWNRLVTDERRLAFRAVFGDERAPFALPAPVVDKLRYVHELVRAWQ